MRSIFVFVMLFLSALAFAPNFENPSLSVSVGPSAVDPGQCLTVYAREENPSLPLFDYTFSAWLPCGRDWEEVTTWSARHDRGGQPWFYFSGVLARRTVQTVYGPSFEYEQCHYTWSLSRGARGSPIVSPNNAVNLDIVLCANRGARAGTYEMDAEDSYNFPRGRYSSIS